MSAAPVTVTFYCEDHFTEVMRALLKLVAVTAARREQRAAMHRAYRRRSLARVRRKR